MFLGCYTYYKGKKYPERALINNQEVNEIDELKRKYCGILVMHG
jgi:hypothetical protein